MGRKLVDSRWIHHRMNLRDARVQADARRREEARIAFRQRTAGLRIWDPPTITPVVVDVELVPVSIDTADRSDGSDTSRGVVHVALVPKSDGGR